MANDRLARELDTLLAELGVLQEGSQTKPEPPRDPGNLHLTCLYARKDQALWHVLEPHLHLFERAHAPSLTIHIHAISNTRAMHDPQVARPIKEHLAQADIVLLGISVDLALSFLEHGEEIATSLKMRGALAPVQLLGLFLRPVTWQPLLQDWPFSYQELLRGESFEAQKHRDRACQEIVQVLSFFLQHCEKEREAHRAAATTCTEREKGEADEDERRIERLLRTGTANQCLDEARHWIEYSIANEDAELEALSTAMACVSRAQQVINGQPPSLGKGPEESEGNR